MILSERPLADGRSPQSRVSDRTWVSRFIVHAPVDASQERLFRDFGVAAQRIMDRLRSGRPGSWTCAEILDMVCGEPGEAMARALDACHENVRLYRNALARMCDGEGYTVGERTEAAMVLFVAAGCTADVGRAVDYTMEYIRCSMGGRLGTPTSCPVSLDPRKIQVDLALPHVLGFVRIVDGVVAGAPHWVSSDSEGVEIGALATGVDDITDVDGDVSAHHARVWHEPDATGEDGRPATGPGRWMLSDLGSSNGTAVVDGDGAEPRRIEGGEAVEVHPGDEIRLGRGTTFVLVEGMADMAR